MGLEVAGTDVMVGAIDDNCMVVDVAVEVSIVELTATSSSQRSTSYLGHARKVARMLTKTRSVAIQSGTSVMARYSLGRHTARIYSLRVDAWNDKCSRVDHGIR